MCCVALRVVLRCVLCCVVLCCVACCVVLCCVVLCCVVLCCGALCCVVLCCAVVRSASNNVLLRKDQERLLHLSRDDERTTISGGRSSARSSKGSTRMRGLSVPAAEPLPPVVFNVTVLKQERFDRSGCTCFRSTVTVVVYVWWRVGGCRRCGDGRCFGGGGWVDVGAVVLALVVRMVSSRVRQHSNNT